MRKVSLFVIIISSAILSACNKDAEVLNLPSINDYYPLQVSKYVTYSLDSTVFINFGKDAQGSLRRFAARKPDGPASGSGSGGQLVSGERPRRHPVQHPRHHRTQGGSGCVARLGRTLSRRRGRGQQPHLDQQCPGFDGGRAARLG